MSDDLNTVKKKSYHHGSLRSALISAGEAILAEKGVEGFSLREAARRAGVSPAAPGYHFGDIRGLLTAIAELGFRDLAERLEAAAREPDRAERLKKMATAYVQFAVAERARFDLMWRSALLGDDPGYREAQDRAFTALDRAVRGVDSVVEMPDAPELAPSIALWALAHGFSRILLDGGFGLGDEAIDRAVKVLLPAVLANAGWA